LFYSGYSSELVAYGAEARGWEGASLRCPCRFSRPRRGRPKGSQNKTKTALSRKCWGEPAVAGRDPRGSAEKLGARSCRSIGCFASPEFTPPAGFVLKKEPSRGKLHEFFIIVLEFFTLF
jgi:hypothetical protein